MSAIYIIIKTVTRRIMIAINGHSSSRPRIQSIPLSEFQLLSVGSSSERESVLFSVLDRVNWCIAVIWAASTQRVICYMPSHLPLS